MVDTKYCTHCNILKPTSEFYITKRQGFITPCKSCFLIRNRKLDLTPKRKYIRYRDSVRTRSKRCKNGNQYLRNSEKFIIEFRLSFDEFMQFWHKPCYYCGDEILTIGLDRVNNNDHYTVSNVVPCCRECNWMKSDMTQEDFYKKCEHVLNTWCSLGR